MSLGARSEIVIRRNTGISYTRVNMRIYIALLLIFFNAMLALDIDSGQISPVVDLGYGVYEGYYNSSSNLNIFKGSSISRNLFLRIQAQDQC